MVWLEILSGKRAGTRWEARHFPVRVGRAQGCDLSLDDNGVWDQHFQILFDKSKGFVLAANPSAYTTVNGQSLADSLLRNGDVIEAGGVKLRFALAPTQHRSLVLREVLTWLAIASLFFLQVGLIYLLLD